MQFQVLGRLRVCDQSSPTQLQIDVDASFIPRWSPNGSRLLDSRSAFRDDVQVGGAVDRGEHGQRRRNNERTRCSDHKNCKRSDSLSR